MDAPADPPLSPLLTCSRAGRTSIGGVSRVRWGRIGHRCLRAGAAGTGRDGGTGCKTDGGRGRLIKAQSTLLSPFAVDVNKHGGVDAARGGASWWGGAGRGRRSRVMRRIFTSHSYSHPRVTDFPYPKPSGRRRPALTPVAAASQAKPSSPARVAIWRGDGRSRVNKAGPARLAPPRCALCVLRGRAAMRAPPAACPRAGPPVAASGNYTYPTYPDSPKDLRTHGLVRASMD